MSEQKLPDFMWVIKRTLGDAFDAVRVSAALDAAGYVIVPKEPTQEMISAPEGWRVRADGPAYCYRAMLAASQQKGG